MVSVRLPIGTLAKLQKLADENSSNRCRYIINILVNASKTPTAQELEADFVEAFTFGEAE
jgi:hypothetical protein